MSWNMPSGATSDDYDRWCGYDLADDEEEEIEEDPAEEIPPDAEPTEEELAQWAAEDAGDRAYDDWVADQDDREEAA